MMKNRKVFLSDNSFDDAAFKCKMAGYIPDGYNYNNKTGKYMVFGFQNSYF